MLHRPHETRACTKTLGCSTWSCGVPAVTCTSHQGSLMGLTRTGQAREFPDFALSCRFLWEPPGWQVWANREQMMGRAEHRTPETSVFPLTGHQVSGPEWELQCLSTLRRHQLRLRPSILPSVPLLDRPLHSCPWRKARPGVCVLCSHQQGGGHRQPKGQQFGKSFGEGDGISVPLRAPW